MHFLLVGQEGNQKVAPVGEKRRKHYNLERIVAIVCNEVKKRF